MSKKITSFRLTNLKNGYTADFERIAEASIFAVDEEMFAENGIYLPIWDEKFLLEAFDGEEWIEVDLPKMKSIDHGTGGSGYEY